MSRWIEPLTLEGEHVKLVPLTLEHEAALTAAASDGELWKLWYTFVPLPEETRAYIDIALDMRDRLGALPWSSIKRAATWSARRVTSAVERANRRLEIGHTWYAKRVQKSALNTEAKLLLTHAFENARHDRRRVPSARIS